MCADDEDQAGPIEYLVLGDVDKEYPHWVGVCGLHADGWYEGCEDNLELDIRDGIGPCYQIGVMARNDWAAVCSSKRTSMGDAIAKSPVHLAVASEEAEPKPPKPDPEDPSSLEKDGDTYLILGVFQRSWSSDFEICRDEGRTPVQQLAAELQDAYLQAGVAGHFKLFMPEV
jgi:hypothetical protein